MKSLLKTGFAFSIGLDLGDKHSTIHVIGHEKGEFVESGKVRTTKEAIAERFRAFPRSRVALEVGTHSPWVSRILKSLGHEVLVANPRQFRMISDSQQKSDAFDPETLARVARFDPKLLRPVEHRGKEHQTALAVLRSRDCLVRVRTLLVNHVRGSVKSFGGRIKSCSTASFHHIAIDSIPDEIKTILRPAIKVIEDLSKKIRRFEKEIDRLCEKEHPEVKQLWQVQGVGAVTALAFALVIGDPRRFKSSRKVGPYTGLVPQKRQSGKSDPQLRITKAGDGLLRRLLVGSAHYILGPFGPDSDLRRHGLAIAQRGGKNAKKRAVVAVARKLAVLLHRLWITGEVYEPLRNSNRRVKQTVN